MKGHGLRERPPLAGAGRRRLRPPRAQAMMHDARLRLHAISEEFTMRTLILLVSLLLVSTAHAEAKYKELFNGKDLKGWEGDDRIWSVEDGLLTGNTKGVTLEHNSFCIWTGGEVGDFELEAVFRMEGDNNSGIQYRSARYPKNGKYAVIGYQADIHPAANYIGMLYDEGGRGIAAEHGQQVTLGPADAKDVKKLPGKVEAVDLGKWNKLEVKAAGNHLIHKINGEVTVDVTDNDPKNAEAKGILALQVHVGPAMKVQFKSIRLKSLVDEKARNAKDGKSASSSK